MPYLKSCIERLRCSIRLYQRLLLLFICVLISAAGAFVYRIADGDIYKHRIELLGTEPARLPFRSETLEKLGENKAIIFSPDIAATGNQIFYRRLGFHYLETASWEQVLKNLVTFNHEHHDQPIREVFLEVHGCNGNGLKLQDSYLPNAKRSYISLGGLQERLASSQIEEIILTACNTGRLFRPEIYNRLDLRVKDKTVLPATLGVVNASLGFDAPHSSIRFLRRAESRIEQTSEGYFNELSPAVRQRLGLPDSQEPFVVSNLFMQMVLGDQGLRLTNTGYSREVSSATEDEATNEAIFQQFLVLLKELAEKR